FAGGFDFGAGSGTALASDMVDARALRRATRPPLPATGRRRLPGGRGAQRPGPGGRHQTGGARRITSPGDPREGSPVLPPPRRRVAGGRSGRGTGGPRRVPSPCGTCGTVLTAFFFLNPYEGEYGDGLSASERHGTAAADQRPARQR